MQVCQRSIHKRRANPIGAHKDWIRRRLRLLFHGTAACAFYGQPSRRLDVSIDLLPVPHFVSMFKREADLAITLERHERIGSVADLRHHAFIDYVADLAFSHGLLYLNRAIPDVTASLCSTSTIAHHHAALQGNALAILPFFMTAPYPRLIPILSDEIVITWHFWLSIREDLCKLCRITSPRYHTRAAADENRSLLLGESAEMQFIDA